MTERVIFMGSPAFAVPALHALADRPAEYEVVGVVTQPDAPVGRGRTLQPCAVAAAARARGLDVLQPTKLKTAATRDLLAERRPAVMVVAAYGRILPPTLLALPPHGCINVHASLLPRHRGASPIAHAILLGDAQTGVAIMQMDAGLDTGPVFATRALAIEPDDTAERLGDRLALLGADLLVATLPDILTGRRLAQPQASEGATYAPLLAKSDGALHFEHDADELARRVRAFSPWPGTFAFNGEHRVAVLQARADPPADPPANAPAGAAPGRVLDASQAGVRVACGRGILVLLEVKPAGRQAMSAGAWAAGRGVHVGDLLRAQPPPS